MPFAADSWVAKLKLAAPYDDLRARERALQTVRMKAESWADKLKLLVFDVDTWTQTFKVVPFGADPCATTTWFYKLVERNEYWIAREAFSFGDGTYLTQSELNSVPTADHCIRENAFTLNKLSGSTTVQVHAPCLRSLLQDVPGLASWPEIRFCYDNAAILEKLDLLEARLTSLLIEGFDEPEVKVLQLLINCVRGYTADSQWLLSDHYSKPDHLSFGAALLNDMDQIDQHMVSLWRELDLKTRTFFLTRTKRLEAVKAIHHEEILLSIAAEDEKKASIFDQRYAATMRQRLNQAHRAKLFETFNELHSSFVTMSNRKGASNQCRRLGRRFDGPFRLYEAGSSAMRRLLYEKEAPRDIAGTFGAVLLADAMQKNLAPAAGNDEQFLRDIGPWYAQLCSQEDRELFEELAFVMWDWTPTEDVPRGQIDTEELKRLVDQLQKQLEFLIPRTAQYIRHYAADEKDVGSTENSQAEPVPSFDCHMEEIYGAQGVGKDIPPEPPDISIGDGLLQWEIPSNALILLMGCIFKAYIAFLILCRFGQVALDSVHESYRGFGHEDSLCANLAVTVCYLSFYSSLAGNTHGEGSHFARDNDHVAWPQAAVEEQNPARTASTNHQPRQYDLFPRYLDPHVYTSHSTREPASTLTAAHFPISTHSSRSSTSSFADLQTEHGHTAGGFPTEPESSYINDPFQVDWSEKVMASQPHDHSSNSASTGTSLSTSSPYPPERQQINVSCENCGQSFRGKYARTNCRRHQRVDTCRMHADSRQKLLCRHSGCGQSFSRSDNRNTHERTRHGRVLA